MRRSFGDRVYVEDDGRERPAYGNGTVVGFDDGAPVVQFDSGYAGIFAVDFLLPVRDSVRRGS